MKDILSKKVLIDNYIFDKNNNKVFDVFLVNSSTTILSLGWFNNDGTPTKKGVEQLKLLKQNLNL